MGGLLSKPIISGVLPKSLLSKPKVVKPPVAKPTPPIPTVGEEVETQAKRKRPRGRRETFLTGDLIPMLGEKKERLG